MPPSFEFWSNSSTQALQCSSWQPPLSASARDVKSPTATKTQAVAVPASARRWTRRRAKTAEGTHRTSSTWGPTWLESHGRMLLIRKHSWITRFEVRAMVQWCNGAMSSRKVEGKEQRAKGHRLKRSGRPCQMAPCLIVFRLNWSRCRYKIKNNFCPSYFLYLKLLMNNLSFQIKRSWCSKLTLLLEHYLKEL